MTERMTTLTVYTTEAEEGRDVFKLLADVAGEMAMTHQSATVSSYKMGDSLDGDDNPEELYHDENTLNLVRSSLLASVEANQYFTGTNEEFVTALISSVQNAGILFRERRR